MKAEQARALVRKTRRIHGWFSPEAAMLFAWIDEIQKSDGVIGDILEIGVHHGKTAVFLGAMLDPDREKLAVCDLFGNQTGNVSGSGSGDRQIFERHWQSCSDGLGVQILEKSSTELTAEEVGRNHRFVHVDGGHTREEALSDLRLAARTTIGDGVIALDDPMTPEWPGVAEAVFHFLSSEEDFCAMAAGFNKMILVRRVAADRYTRHFDDERDRHEYGLTYPWHFKQLTFMNHPLRIFHVPSFIDPRSVKTRLARYYYRHAWLKHPLLRPAISLVRLLTRGQG
ncbi:MAG: class I SAM-dependent methyltransferase [Vicinamibacteria bacterium]